ncbi:ChaC-like protein [Caballeronia arationis]|jgi:cation transport protein ChaC|uniref:glutathione-specific gamma-glutamylcyclotransferase n=1 Tax=Caballeronia arationis TaxID=1777142 RepID=A0A7Z7I270_9BURK|nr:gamma-glutamylcyclotransferase [Caballeronia arationis]SAL06259.1 ChaC-like protein [Caballeronia arationis]SOE54708.1 Cation transport regulator ChaC [Caballeronia arationis]
MDSVSAAPRDQSVPLRLTPELVALTAHKVEDRGPPTGVVVHSESDYETSLQAFLTAGAWQGQDIWVFAYGSLLWNPALEVDEQVAAVLPGWHRAFCIRLTRFRGTPEQPGLMMSLVSGGSCRGALYRIAGSRALENLRKLWRREMTVKPPTSPPRWVTAKAGQAAVGAIVFAADRQGHNFVTGMTDEEIACVLCKAVGHWGSGAEYLMQTVDHLEHLGIRDTNLWRLQRLVAQKLVDLQVIGR